MEKMASANAGEVAIRRIAPLTRSIVSPLNCFSNGCPFAQVGVPAWGFTYTNLPRLATQLGELCADRKHSRRSSLDDLCNYMLVEPTVSKLRLCIG